MTRIQKKEENKMCQDCKKPYYITTAIAYASGKPHIGNTYEIVLADSIARYKRAKGYDVFFQTGTDEHGQKIEEKAEAAGVTPQEFVDRSAGEIRRIWDLMNTSYDQFIRTTDKDHEAQVQKIFKKLYDQGDIYKGAYEGLYCTPCESFWTPSQLVDGKCPDCGREVQPAKEEAYFFRMSKYAPRLIEYINEHPEFIQPVSRKNEMMNNFLLPGLQDLCVSRTTFSWGIPVDFDPKHVTYVWLDALTNYITGIGYDCDGNHTDQFKKYWPADLHLIGKDIIRFHTIYWPIFLMALDLPLPKQVFGHPWLLQGDGKMSKSKGNVVSPDDLVRDYGCDSLRMYELFVGPPELDAEWDDRGIDGVHRFLSRFWTLVEDNADKNFNETDEMVKLRHKMVYDITNRLENFSLNTVVSGFMEYTNKLVDLTKKQGGIDKETMETIVTLLSPFAPHVAEELWEVLGHNQSIFESTQWPSFDEEKMKDNEIEMAVQVNGKVKAKVTLSVDETKESALAKAKEALGDKLPANVVKEIYVPGKIINIVGK